jgi:hypothetical protein
VWGGGGVFLQLRSQYFLATLYFYKIQIWKVHTYPRRQSPGIDSASLCSIAGRYDNPTSAGGIDALESFPKHLKDLQIRAQYCMSLDHAAKTLTYITICCVAGRGVLVPQWREPRLSGFPGQESHARQLFSSSSAR